jgi:hypothetical protein
MAAAALAAAAAAQVESLARVRVIGNVQCRVQTPRAGRPVCDAAPGSTAVAP